MSLTVPTIDPDDDPLTAALAYAKAGWYVLPVAHAQKHPGSIVGGQWQSKSTRDPEQIVAWWAGENHGIALHVGRSGAVVLDVDSPDNLPAVLTDAFTTHPAPCQTTRDGDPRRAHHVYGQPAGRQLGNGTGQLGGTWGEVRGRNGVIIVAPSTHADQAAGGRYQWLRTGPVPDLPDTIGALLHDSVDTGDAATDTAIGKFLTTHTAASRPDLVDGWVRTFTQRTAAGESRHDRMTSILTGALKEARAGYVNAGQAAAALRAAFLTAATSDPVGRQGAARTHTQAAAEWLGILAWSVGQAHAADLADIRDRTERAHPTIGGTAPPRHLNPVPPLHTGTDGPTAPAPAPPPPLAVVHDTQQQLAAASLRNGPTEDGTARTLVEVYGDDIRYCPQRGRWLVWDGARWAWDEAEHLREMVRTIARALPRDDGWKSHQRRALSAAGVSGITRLAQSDPAVTVHVDQLDARPWELNTPGGVVDLRTGALRPADRDALHTRMTSVSPDPTQLTGTDAFSVFLHDTFGGDTQLEGYVQRLLGLACVGLVLEQILPLFFGPGANGKSTLADAVMRVLGTGETGYAMSLPAEALMQRKHSEHPAELAQMLGARLVVCSELDDGQRFAEARVKLLTGGDLINARFMRRDPFTFRPSHTLLLLGNHRPETTVGGPAFWRRIRLLPFDHTVPVARRDPHLPEKLAALSPAILAWMVAGAAQFATSGLQEPATVLAATAEYAAEQDTVARFLDDCCHLAPGSPMVKAKVASVRGAYEAWCAETGSSRLTPKEFGSQLATRHGVRLTKTGSTRMYAGLALLANEDDNASGWTS